MLTVEELTFTYPGMDEPALTDVSFSVPDGQVLGVLGPVGSGRTTLCLSLAGLAPRITGGRSAGDLWVTGIDPRETSAQQMARRVGVVFQDQSAQITQVTVLDEVAAALIGRGWPVTGATARARELLGYVGLGEQIGGVDAARKRTWELSGGQQQRVAVAAVLAMDPQVIVFDNATAALDPEGRREIARIIRELRGDKTILVVEEADFLADVADRVLVMDQGRARACGPAGEVLRDVETLARAGIEPPMPLRIGRALGATQRPLTAAEFEHAFAGRTAQRVPAARAPVDLQREHDRPVPFGDLGTTRPAIHVHDATYRYADGTVAIRRMSLRVHRGEVHAVVGGNGAGKTTMVKLLVGLLEPADGWVLVEGTETRGRHVADLAQHVGTALQNPDEQITEPTVADEVAFPLQRRRHQRSGLLSRRERYDDEYIRAQVHRACTAVGLGESLFDRDPSLLPHGQRKLVTIAEALVLDPAVLVLDEPSAGLDVGARRHLQRVITELRQRGTAVVLIDHDMDLVCELAQTVTVLARGSVALHGRPAEVFAAPNRHELARLTVAPSRAAQLAARIGLSALTYEDLVAELLRTAPDEATAEAAAWR